MFVIFWCGNLGGGETVDLAVVEAPLEPAKRIETEQEDGQHIKHYDNYDTQHKVRKVVLTQVLQGVIKCT